MPARHRTAKRKTRTSSRGPRGKTGRRGPRGPTGRAGNDNIAKLAAQMEQVLTELQYQLTRIAQIQAQLDRFAAGHEPESSERRRTRRTSH